MENYTIVVKNTGTHYDTNEESFLGGKWEKTKDTKEYLEQLIKNNPNKFEGCEIQNELDSLKITEELNLLDRLEITEEGDGCSYEVWVDPDTNKYYIVPIEIVRDWVNIELS
tara:strand:+ start:224 stop:559 length:336 start_codon:yes stop_codon:yes gene_type:complete